MSPRIIQTTRGDERVGWDGTSGTGHSEVVLFLAWLGPSNIVTRCAQNFTNQRDVLVLSQVSNYENVLQQAQDPIWGRGYDDLE